MKKLIWGLTLLFGLGVFSSVCFAQVNDDNLYRTVLEKEIEVTAEALNIRTGPGTQYPEIGIVKKGDVLPVLGALGSWYVVYLPDGSIGVISGKYSKVLSMNESYMPQGDDTGEEYATGDVGDAEMIFSMANKARLENKMQGFVWDEKLNRTAQLKAEDMKANGYFGHYSEIYGTPFAMLKQTGGFSYKTASENIAGSISVESAMASIMSSPSHRSNILNSRFNKMGVGIVDDAKYGKIVVQMFIEE